MSPDSAALIYSYFPALTQQQQEQVEALYPLYAHWNTCINLISRKDMEHFYLRHVLHSMGIAKVINLPDGASVIDIGTGGGFPGIPLAILLPQCRFLLADSIGKKIKVVQTVAAELRLENVRAVQARAESLKEKCHFITSRGVAPIKELKAWTRHLFLPHKQGHVPNGYILLKGGNLTEEIIEARAKARIFDLSDYFREDFFETKKVLLIKPD